MQKALAEWYTEQLGKYHLNQQIPARPITLLIIIRIMKQVKKHYTAFSILQSKHRPQLEFHAFCLNLRVYNLGELHASLQSKNIAIKAIESYPEGKFSQLTDPENNLIELWEDTAV
jgi:hypothetical protein